MGVAHRKMLASATARGPFSSSRGRQRVETEFWECPEQRRISGGEKQVAPRQATKRIGHYNNVSVRLRLSGAAAKTWASGKSLKEGAHLASSEESGVQSRRGRSQECEDVAQEQTGHEESDEKFAEADPDVLLDVPEVKVEELNLEVEDLQAQTSLRTRLSELLNIDIGVNVSLNSVNLEAKGVEAVAQLKARLENVNSIVARTLSSLDDNPQLLKDLTELANAASGAQNEGSRPTLRGVGENGAGEKAAPVEIEATKAARRKAGELGVELSSIEGSGSGGRITVKDVARASNRG
jgi:pyruvate/2-oxoglutarate dehydrogenase complex dihydrolipoamide acyltransferase (E2) component